MAQKDVLKLIIEVCNDNRKIMLEQKTPQGMAETYALLVTAVTSICGGAIRMAGNDEQNVG